jgi:hypothetical protein
MPNGFDWIFYLAVLAFLLASSFANIFTMVWIIWHI